MKTDVSKLSVENYSVYVKMTNYLAEKHLRRSDYERVCEDIFLMLADAQERGETAESLFPGGYGKFLDEVAANCPKENRYVTALAVLFWATAVLAAVTLIVTLFTYLWPDEGEWISGVTANVELSGFTGAIIASCVGASASICHNIFSFEKKRYYYISLAVTVAVAIIVEVLIGVFAAEQYITFNWVALACSCAGCAVALWLARFGILKLSAKNQ